MEFHEFSSDNFVNLELLLAQLESSECLRDSEIAYFSLYTALVKSLAVSGGNYPNLQSLVNKVTASKHFIAANEKTNATSKAAAPATGKKEKAAKKEKGGAASAAPTVPVSFDDIVTPVLGEIDWSSTGLVSDSTTTMH
jgi:hypothetical protein